MDDGVFFKKFFKWIGRGLKKVGKFLKKVAPIALLAASAFFTFGAALGVTAGWGAIVSGAMAKVGLSGTVASVVGGSIAQAGYGALAGGIGGAVTGKGFVKGAQAGALVGAVTGGVSGGLGIGPGIAQGKESLTGTPASSLADKFSESMTQSFPPPPSPSLLSRVGKTAGKVWKEANKGSALLGPIIGGIGGGIAQNAQVAEMEERRKRIQNSYDVPAESYYSTPESRQREQGQGRMQETQSQSLAPAPKTSLLDASERILQRRRPQ